MISYYSSHRKLSLFTTFSAFCLVHSAIATMPSVIPLTHQDHSHLREPLLLVPLPEMANTSFSDNLFWQPYTKCILPYYCILLSWLICLPRTYYSLSALFEYGKVCLTPQQQRFGFAHCCSSPAVALTMEKVLSKYPNEWWKDWINKFHNIA